MNFIKSIVASYRAYFEHPKKTYIGLTSKSIKDMSIAALLMISLIVIIGLLTRQLSSFLYIFLSTTSIILILSSIYIYMSSGKDRHKDKGVYLIPWFKWVNMLFLYQSLILSTLYIKLVPVVLIFILSIYAGLSIIFFNFIETTYEFHLKTFSKTMNTSLLLYIGHYFFLYVLPIRHVVISYLVILIMLVLSFMLKDHIKRFSIINYPIYRSNKFAIILLLIISISYIVTSSIPNIKDEVSLEFFSHEAILRDEVNIKKSYIFGQEEIINLVTSESDVYVQTMNKVYQLDHNLSIKHTIHTSHEKLIDTNQGVMLFKYVERTQNTPDQGYPFTLSVINNYGILDTYLNFYIDTLHPVKYIHFDQYDIYFFVENNSYGGEIRHYDGNQFITYGNYEEKVIQTDDIYLEMNGAYIYGVHRSLGAFLDYYIDDHGSPSFRRYYKELEGLNDIFTIATYGYGHLIYASMSNHDYYHETTSSIGDYWDLRSNNEHLEEAFHVQEDGSIYLQNMSIIKHFDAYFGPISSYYLDGEKLTFEDDKLFYIEGSMLHLVDLNDLGSYQVIHQRRLIDYIWILSLGILFVTWQTYAIKPDAY